jgi:hypothetical protein
MKTIGHGGKPQNGALFPLGQVVATPGALAVLTQSQMLACLREHVRGQWGVINPDDVAVNAAALREGDRLLSAYYIDPTKPDRGKFWVITEADRSSTTVLLPDEY